VYDWNSKKLIICDMIEGHDFCNLGCEMGKIYYLNWGISGGAKRGAKLSSDTSRLRVSRIGTNLWLLNKSGGSGSKGFGLVGSDRIYRGNRGVVKVSDGQAAPLSDSYFWAAANKVGILSCTFPFIFLP